MKDLDLGAVQKRYKQTTENLSTLLEGVSNRIVERRWYRGDYVTDAFPIPGYAAGDSLELDLELLPEEPEEKDACCECGFDGSGTLLMVRAYGEPADGIQTQFVLEEHTLSDGAAFIAACYFYDEGAEPRLNQTFQYYEQYFEATATGRRPAFGLKLSDPNRYTLYEYAHDDQGRVIKSRESNERMPVDASPGELLDAVEQKYGAKVPQQLRALHVAGDHRYGASQKEWRATSKARAFSNPPALLCAPDVEWLTGDEMLNWKPVDYWNPEHRLLPFAGNGAGDLWCFYLNWGNESRLPVVLAYHDENRCEAVAGDFQSFLLVKFIGSLTNIDKYVLEHLELDDAEQYRPSLVANLKTLESYLPETWTLRLREILTAPLLNDGDTHAFLTPERTEILLAELKFEHSGTVFEHMNG